MSNNREEKVSIYIATHLDRAIKVPEDPIYVPMMCGAYNKTEFYGYRRDNEGKDNISKYNKNYCELTAQYWAWKNDHDSDILGLVHYHRFFMGKNGNAATRKEILRELEGVDAIINGSSSAEEYCSIEDSIYTSYKNTHKQKTMDLVIEAYKKLYPDEYPLFERQIFHSGGMACNNMIIARRAIFEEYSEWLFSLLQYALDHEWDDWKDYDDYNKRHLGFCAERLQRIFFTIRGYKTRSMNIGDAGNDICCDDHHHFDDDNNDYREFEEWKNNYLNEYRAWRREHSSELKSMSIQDRKKFKIDQWRDHLRFQYDIHRHDENNFEEQKPIENNINTNQENPEPVPVITEPIPEPEPEPIPEPEPEPDPYEDAWNRDSVTNKNVFGWWRGIVKRINPEDIKYGEKHDIEIPSKKPDDILNKNFSNGFGRQKIL